MTHMEIAERRAQIGKALEALRKITGAAYYPATARRDANWQQEIQHNHEVVAREFFGILGDLEEQIDDDERMGA